MEKVYENELIKKALIRLEETMINYLEYEDEDLEDEVAYDRGNIDECMNLLNNFLKDIEEISEKQKAIDLVKDVVLALNKLNEKCDFELIETEQREDICEIIILATNLKGFNPENQDLTEEWREF